MNKGSFTVEASLLIPALIIIMVISMKVSMNFYQEIRRQSMETWKEPETVEQFYIRQGIKEVIND